MSRILYIFVIRLLVHAQKDVDYGCYDFQFNPRVCLPGPIDIAESNNFNVDPSLTCGVPPSTYCRSAKPSGCYTCNSSSATNNHPVRYMTDKDYPLNYWNFGYKPTWWQSVTWWDAKQRNLLKDNTLKIQLVLSMNKSYDLTGSIKITFYSSKPHAFVIEKSSDFGKTWTPYRYYADQCSIRFPSITLESNTNSQSTRNTNSQSTRNIFCREHKSVAAVQGSQVEFTPSFTTDNFWEKDTQMYLFATDFRISLEYPWTDNNERINQESFLNKYYYDITDIQIHGRCHCNGHAPYCDSNKRCYCQHNTNGVDCEECLPLFNNKLWRPAEASDKPNPCEACECNNHADSCYYNSTLGHGICNDCQNGTSGFFCHQCDTFFYRNTTVDITHPATCVACECYLPGVTNNGECMMQNMTTSSTNQTVIADGQCSCKPNLHGRRCDGCQNGFFGLRSQPVGDCEACNCSTYGSVNMDITCAQVSGQCRCKQTTYGQTCSDCKPEYYYFPNTTQDECRKCNCNVGGSLTNNCNQTSGKCFCRSGVDGTICNQVSKDMYTPSFNHYLFEAESSLGRYTVVSVSGGQNVAFTGYGYAMMGSSDEMLFAFSPEFTALFHVLLRYKNLEQESSITIDISYTNDSVSFPLVSSMNVSLDAGSNYTVVSSLVLVHNGNYTFEISNNSSETILLDSLVLLPNFEDSLYYTVSNESIRRLIHTCWNKSLVTRHRHVSEGCVDHVFGVSTEWFNGTKECDCNPIGSMNFTCDPFGGQCFCKPGVMGLNCDQCMAGYFNFTINGCQECLCDSDGSTRFDCHRTTGQCSCEQNVTSMRCNRCLDNFYGFGTPSGCKSCQCDENGASSLQCLDDGACVCKGSTQGLKCDACEVNYYNFTSTGCSSCGCDEKGSSNLQCSQDNGECDCKQNVAHPKCSACKPGFFHLDSSNGRGCQQCFCFNKTQECQSGPDFYTKPYDSDLFEWIRVNGGNFVTTQDSFQFNLSSNVFKLTAPIKYTGNKLYLFRQKIGIDFVMYFMPTNGNVNRSFELVVTGKDGLSFGIPIKNLSNGVRYTEQFHLTAESTMLSTWELQAVLSQVERLDLNFMGGEADGGFLYGFAMDELVVQGSGGSSFGGVESCSCPQNYTGGSCESCANGYTRAQMASGSWDSCLLCACNNRSTECHPTTGICANCRRGSEGSFCERCQANVLEPRCDRCQPGFYGFDDDTFVGCKACNCIAVNTLNNRTDVCDSETGQCLCKPDIGGRRCDRCAENAANVSDACEDCGICHGLIQDEVHALRSQIRIFKTLIENSTTSASYLLSDATFPQLISNITATVARVSSKVNSTLDMEQDLSKDFAMLGESLDAVEKILELNLTADVNVVRAKLVQILAQQNHSENSMQSIYNFLWMSVYVINDDVSNRSLAIPGKVEELQRVENNFTALASQRMLVYAPILKELASLLNATSSIVAQTEHISNTSLDIGSKLNDTATNLKDFMVATTSQELLTSSLMSQSATFLNKTNILLMDLKSTAQEIKDLNISSAKALLKELENRKEHVESEVLNLKKTFDELQASFQRVNNASRLFLNLSSIVLQQVSASNHSTLQVYQNVLRANEMARNATFVANTTFETANKMLSVLLNYEEAIFNSSSSLKDSMDELSKLNSSSFEVLQFVNQMKMLTFEILQNATAVYNGSLDLKDGSQDVREKTLKVLSIVNALERKPVLKTNLSEIEAIFRATNEISYQSYTLKTRCANFTNTTMTSLKESNSSFKWASEAKADKKLQQEELESISRDLENIHEVDSSRITALQLSLGQSRTKFNQMKLTHALEQLRNTRDDMSNKISNQKQQVRSLNEEIGQLKELYNSMKSARGCG